MKRLKLEMKLGAEPKKAAFLVGLLALVPVAYYLSDSSSAPPGASTSPTRPAARPAAPSQAKSPLQTRAQQQADATPAAETAAPKNLSGRASAKEFRPSLKPKKGEERDVEKMDASLRLDLLEKLQHVQVLGGERSLFDFSSSPERRPKLPEPKIDLKKKAAAQVAPPVVPSGPPPQPVKPPPPPIPLKFYGNAVPQRGARRVFCMNGDEVQAPAEGEVLQRRYKIIQINATNVVVEDLEYKNRQTLPIEEVPAAG